MPLTRRIPYRRGLPLLPLAAALFFSGVAAVINETIWQRALKIYVSGVNATSAMLVVFVFMLGLGAGAIFVGTRSERLRDPLRPLLAAEFGLVIANVAIALALSHGRAESLYAVQRVALSFGVPLSVIYAALAIAILLLPCFLMGTTMPLAAEAAQRQVGDGSSRFVVALFAVNTFGSVLGGVASGLYLLPHFGQIASLVAAIACNGLATLLLVGMVLTRPRPARPAAPAAAMTFRRGRLTPGEVLAFWLGLLALGYEMYVFRMAALHYGPTAYRFAAVLVVYLFLWSVGLLLAGIVSRRIATVLTVTAVVVSLEPFFPAGALMFLPCLLFGWLFGQAVADTSRRWGRDVGRFYALNTAGACVGVVAVTGVGFQFDPAYTALFAGLAYLVLLVFWRARQPAPNQSAHGRRLGRLGVGLLACGAAALLVVQVGRDVGLARTRGDGAPLATKYFGRNGVIEVTNNADLLWNGLWHSRLSYGGDQVGTNNWLLAVIPFLAHGGRHIDNALVIGLGTGVTAATLAESRQVGSVDVYEFDRTLRDVLRDYPLGTLHVADNPKVAIRWQDARSGLALDPRQYDLITQQPLYLKQAGSSLLLSREYMQLVSRRMKRGGVLAIYSNALGSPDEALIVRKTVAGVFPYYESFGGGYAIVASNQPFTYSPEGIDAMDPSDPLVREMRAYGKKGLRLMDVPPLEWQNCPYEVTDDQPLVEYPGLCTSLMRQWRAGR